MSYPAAAAAPARPSAARAALLHFLALAACVFVTASAAAGGDTPPSKVDVSRVPGVVVSHSRASSGLYVGSPSLAVLPGGDYLASHDLFGPKSHEFEAPVTKVFCSADRGKSWSHVSDVRGAFWSSLFAHGGKVYLLGTSKHHGHAVIRRSDDGGKSWTTPRDGESGLLRAGEFHCAPMPVIVHRGRLWRAMEDAGGGKKWGERYRAMMMSAAVDANLLKSASWTFSNALERDGSWNRGRFNAWLEGNAVVAPDGRIVNVLRVDVGTGAEVAAIVNVSDDGRTATFDPAAGIVPFPGGAKKFAIRHDAKSKRYWSLGNLVLPRHASGNPAGTRNAVALVSSPDLRTWDVRCVVLYHPDHARHGFQYVDWLFDGDDLIALSRTAYDDGLGGARNNHDANFVTFHRIAYFRDLTMKDSVPMPDGTAPPATQQ